MRRMFQKFLEFAFLQTVGVLGFSAYSNLSFGFNVMSRAHWRHFMDMQLDGNAVALGFYAALFGFIIYSVIVVWFVLVRPRRRINFVRPDPRIMVVSPAHDYVPLNVGAPQKSPVMEVAKMEAAPAMPDFARPPRMSPGVASYNNYESPAVIQPVVVQPVVSTPTPVIPEQTTQEIKSSSAPEVIRILESTGFTIGNPPKIEGVQLDVWAMNGDELTIGIVCGAHGRITAREGGRNVWTSDIDGDFDSPVAGVYSAVEALQALFAETLDAGMQIKITAFVVCPEGNIENFDKLQSVWDAFGVKVFAHGVPEMEAWARGVEMLEKNESFIEYMNTVVWYYSDGKKT